jgi:hypothetical protein
MCFHTEKKKKQTNKQDLNCLEVGDNIFAIMFNLFALTFFSPCLHVENNVQNGTMISLESTLEW